MIIDRVHFKEIVIWIDLMKRDDGFVREMNSYVKEPFLQAEIKYNFYKTAMQALKIFNSVESVMIRIGSGALFLLCVD